MSTIYLHHCCCRSLCWWSEILWLTLPKCWCLICGWYGHMKVLQRLCGAFPLIRPLTRGVGLDFCHSTLSLSQPAQQLGSGSPYECLVLLVYSPKWLECGPFLLIWRTLLAFLHGSWWSVSCFAVAPLSLLCHLFPFLFYFVWGQSGSLFPKQISKCGAKHQSPSSETSIFRCHSVLPSHIRKHLALRVDFSFFPVEALLLCWLWKPSLFLPGDLLLYPGGGGREGMVYLGRVGSSSVWRSASSET